LSHGLLQPRIVFGVRRDEQAWPQGVQSPLPILERSEGYGRIHLQVRVDAQFPEHLHQLCGAWEFQLVLTMHPGPKGGVAGARRTHERGHTHPLARMRGELHDKRADVLYRVDDMGGEHDIGGLDLRLVPWTRHERDVVDAYLRSQVTQGLAHAR